VAARMEASSGLGFGRAALAVVCRRGSWGGGIGPERADFDLLLLLRDEVVIEGALLVHVGFDDASGEAAGKAAMFARFKKIQTAMSGLRRGANPTNQALSLMEWAWPIWRRGRCSWSGRCRFFRRSRCLRDGRWGRCR